MKENIEPIENYGLSSMNGSSSLFSKVGICGGGAVGCQIAQMVSRRGIDVIFIETSEEKINNFIDDMSAELDEIINRWSITQGEKRAILSRIKGSTDFNALNGCSIVIEAFKVESSNNFLAVRKDVLKKIEKAVEKDTIIATNTSTLKVSELASELHHPERCVNLHITISAPEASIVEVVKGLHTNESTYKNAIKFVELLNKIVIPVKESTGLISVRLFVSIINEACNILNEGVGRIEDIDKTMRFGMGMFLGPFEMADKIGLDKLLRWANNIYDGFGDLKYKPSPLIEKMINENQLGIATKAGFYKYDDKGKKM